MTRPIPHPAAINFSRRWGSSRGYGFVAVYPEPDVADLIEDWTSSFAAQPTAAEDVHCTLAFDRDDPLAEDLSDPELFHEATILHNRILGSYPGHHLTLALDGETLHSRHHELRDLGFAHGFDSYVPHITVASEPTSREARAALRELPALQRELPWLGLYHETWSAARK